MRFARRASLTVLAVAALAVAKVSAGEPTIEAPFQRHGTPTAVSIATSTYTKVPATTTLSQRTTVLIDNPSTNSSIMHGHVGNCTSTSISTSTVLGPIEISPASNTGEIGLGNDECIWLVSRNGSSGAESVTVQELSQRNGP